MNLRFDAVADAHGLDLEAAGGSLGEGLGELLGVLGAGFIDRLADVAEQFQGGGAGGAFESGGGVEAGQEEGGSRFSGGPGEEPLTPGAPALGAKGRGPELGLELFGVFAQALGLLAGGQGLGAGGLDLGAFGLELLEGGLLAGLLLLPGAAFGLLGLVPAGLGLHEGAAVLGREGFSAAVQFCAFLEEAFGVQDLRLAGAQLLVELLEARRFRHKAALQPGGYLLEFPELARARFIGLGDELDGLGVEPVGFDARRFRGLGARAAGLGWGCGRAGRRRGCRCRRSSPWSLIPGVHVAQGSSLLRARRVATL